MSKSKKRVDNLKQSYKHQGEERNLYKEKGENITSNYKTEKLIVLKEYEPLFKDNIIKIISDIGNYKNNLECQLCHKEIQDTMAMNYFHLHTEDSQFYITFHFLCALKPNCIEKFQDMMGQFDYISHKNGIKAI